MQRATRATSALCARRALPVRASRRIGRGAARAIGLLSVLCLPLFPAPVLAAAVSLSLAEAVDAALAHQPALNVARARVQQSQAIHRGARSVYYPQLSLNAHGLASTNVPSSASVYGVDDVPRLTGAATTTSLPARAKYALKFNGFLGVGGHVRLLDFGQSRARVHAAASAVEANRKLCAQAQEDVILEVAQAYYAQAASYEVLRIAEDALARVTEHHAMVNASAASGMRPRIDITRSEAELAAARLQLIRARAAARLHRGLLQTAIGWARTDIAVTPLHEAAFAAPPERSRLRHLALEKRADLAASRALIVQAQRLRAAARASHLPQLDISANATSRGTGDSPLHTFNWGVGAVLQLPLFRGFAIEAQAQEARAAERAAEAQLQLQTLKLDQALEETGDDLESAHEAVQVAIIQAQGARATLEQAEARYANGLGDIVELTDAQSLFDVAQQAIVQSRLLVLTSYVRLRHVSGDLFEALHLERPINYFDTN